ncbi:MAG: hypothetical protein ABI537_13285 [Casimicrobiaceae bacterium]
MNVPKPYSTTLLALAAVALAGCAGVPPDIASRAPDIKVYDNGQLPISRYDVVRRIWADAWRTSFGAPTFPTRDDAVAALQNEAARAGADGLINVICLDQGRARWYSRAEPAILCYGNAIRLRPAES